MNVTNPTDPGVLFGGTWKKISYRYLIGEGIIEKNSYNGYGSVDDYAGIWGVGPGMTFGEIEHTLTVNEMPSHRHFDLFATGLKIGLKNGGGDGLSLDYSSGSRGTQIYTEVAGGSQPHNNIPPSLSVYMWQRIA